ncbi:MAG TPA: AIR synthase related protein, partial [Gammaproteobacteria bacterium]|nr:AIR synthase related protein [Gammaproteobacteria bacterium]
MNEFELIDRYFKREGSRADVIVGIGDDAALVKPDPGRSMIGALATLGTASGAPGDGAAFARALARTALNRLAARGVSPAWVTLGLSLPAADSGWLKAFSAALFSIIEPFGAVLVGGDTTRGPTAATLVAHGTAPCPRRQDIASPRPGDPVYVTGELGGAAAGKDERGLTDPRPPRVNEGRAAWPYTTAAGDLRESLAATLSRIVGGYGLGVEIQSGQLPVSPAAEETFRRPGGARLLLDASADAELCLVIGVDEEASFN